MTDCVQGDIMDLTVKGVICMAQTSINIRMDKELKKSMEQTCQELGLNMTTAFTIFAKKMTREKRIPFEVSCDPFYSEINLHAIEESIGQLKQGKTAPYFANILSTGSRSFGEMEMYFKPAFMISSPSHAGIKI